MLSRITLHSRQNGFLLAAAIGCAFGLAMLSAEPRAQAVLPRGEPGLADLIERVSLRVKDYYERAGRIVCTNRVLQQELAADLRPRGKPRETVYELLMVREPELVSASRDRGLRLERTLRSVNGRPAGERDQPACTDPKTDSAEPLAFLLPDHRGRYRFSSLTVAPDRSLVIDFEEIAAEPPAARWEGECFTAEGGRVRGRLWLDADTHDVRQVETRLVESFGIAGSSSMRVERSDTAVRLRHVTFDMPVETLLLPESVTTVVVIRGARSPRIRTVETFSDYRRFLSEVEIRGEVDRRDAPVDPAGRPGYDPDLIPSLN